MLPRSLKKLGITNCSLINVSPSESFLFKMHLHFPSLEVLDLTSSGWLSNHSLQAICKCETLQEVVLRGCRHLGECFVYTALATRFGFRHIKSVDLRDTSIGDSEVSCFGRLPEITHLYLGRTQPGEVLPPPGSESNGKITDRGVLSMCLSDPDELSDSGQLQTLCLSWTDVTDRCLKKLAGSFPLKKLDLRGTEVTKLGIEEYSILRPSCEVTHNHDE
jgi:hypothetical protein